MRNPVRNAIGAGDVVGARRAAGVALSSTAVAMGLLAVTVLVLRRESVEHEHFHAPSVFPVLGALISVALLVDTALDDASVFLRAAILLVVGAGLWVVNRLVAGPPDAELDAEGLRAG